MTEFLSNEYIQIVLIVFILATLAVARVFLCGYLDLLNHAHACFTTKYKVIDKVYDALSYVQFALYFVLPIILLADGGIFGNLPKDSRYLAFPLTILFIILDVRFLGALEMSLCNDIRAALEQSFNEETQEH